MLRQCHHSDGATSTGDCPYVTVQWQTPLSSFSAEDEKRTGKAFLVVSVVTAGSTVRCGQLPD